MGYALTLKGLVLIQGLMNDSEMTESAREMAMALCSLFEGDSTYSKYPPEDFLPPWMLRKLEYWALIEQSVIPGLEDYLAFVGWKRKMRGRGMNLDVFGDD